MTTTSYAIDFDAERIMNSVLGWTNEVPSQIWLWALGATAVVSLILVPIGRRAARRLGQASTKPKTAGQDPEKAAELRRDRQLMAASLTPAGLFWLAVLIGSGRGLTAFGRDTLGWHNGWDWLVPATLDGVAVTFAVLAFRALAKERNPDRARRIVWMSTGASAFINFMHEANKPDNGTALGAIYLGILSLMGMLILDEFLTQFEEGQGYIKREKPRFGLRWITLSYPTLCAWLAWTNYPVAKDTEPTLAGAVQHLTAVRSAKTAERNARDAERSTLPSWTRLAPWVRARKLQAILDKATRSARAEQSTREEDHRSALERLAAEHRSATDRLVAEHRAALEHVVAEQSVERSALTATATEQTERLEQALNSAQSTIARLEAERATEAEQARQLAEQLRRAGEQQGNVADLIQRHTTQLQEAERQRGQLAVQIERAQGEARSARAAAEQSTRRAEEATRALRAAEQSTEALIGETRSGAERVEQELRSALTAARSAERSALERAARAERSAAEHAEQITALESRIAEQAEQSTRSVATRSVATRSGGSKAQSIEKDRGHLVDLFRELDPPAGGEGWTQRRVNALTNAGFGANGRAQRLIGLAMQHAAECDEAEHADACITTGWVTGATSTVPAAATTEN